MSDTTTNEKPAETPAPPSDEAPKDGEQNPNPETPGDGEEETPKDGEKPDEEEAPKTPDLSHEDALAEVVKTRAEAANYRVRAREAEEKLASAKTLEEVNEIVANMTRDREAAERSLLVEIVASKYDLPEALASRLQGSTREELEADAKSLSEIAVNVEAPARLQGGLTPDGDRDADSSNPGDLARKYAPRR